MAEPDPGGIRDKIDKDEITFSAEGTVPVYLPDRTEVGRAKLYEGEDGVYADIRLGSGPLKEMIGEGLVGISMVYMGATPDNQDPDACVGENGCKYQEPHDHGFACDKACAICKGIPKQDFHDH